MARLHSSGAETGAFLTENFEQLAGSSGATAFSSDVARSGSLSYKFVASGANQVIRSSFATHGLTTGATGTTYWGTFWFRVPSAWLPYTGSNAALAVWRTAAAGTLCSVRIKSDNTLYLADQSNAQIGSVSAAISADAWHKVDLSVQINAGATDQASFYLNNTLVASTTTGNFSDSAPGAFDFGLFGTPTAGSILYVDDYLLQDSTGSSNNTRPGDEKVVLLLPVSDNALGNWKDGAGGTTNIFGSVDNVPPIGVSVATSGASNQIENNVNAATNNYDANLRSYTAAGIGSSDTITALRHYAVVGSDSTTGSDTISHSIVSNPAIGATSTSCDIVAGTFPTSWNYGKGTLTENPSVTMGTQPVMRVQKVTASTRANSCCAMGMYVAYIENPEAGRLRGIQMIGCALLSIGIPLPFLIDLLVASIIMVD